MRRELFETVGGFRDGIGRIGTRPLGGEETELSIRAHQHWPGRAFLYEPQARIHHRIQPQRATWSYFRARCYAEGLSKAVISRYVGSADGLATERAYTRRDLPLGVIRNIWQGICNKDRAAFLRAGTLIAGLCITTVGYLAGMCSRVELDKVEDTPPIIQRTVVSTEI
jgi:glucosyl-dolichyl phosphate glucuronosyltransferase